MAKNDNVKPALVIDRFHRSRDDAFRFIVALLRTLNLAEPSTGWRSSCINIPSKNGRLDAIPFKQLLSATRMTGIPAELMHHLDRTDSVFGLRGTVGQIKLIENPTDGDLLGISNDFMLWTDSPRIELGLRLGNSQRAVRGPAVIGPLCDCLADDILYFRRRICSLPIDRNGLRTGACYYRAYLAASLSLFDAFLNRYSLVLSNNPQYAGMAQVSQAGRLEERVSLWLQVVATKKLCSINRGREWSDLMSLKDQRNLIVHSLEPYYCYRPADVARHLNMVRGIGGLIARMRENAGHGIIGFAERLRTAPLVRYRSGQPSKP